jgi:uncharacterized protein YjlB
LRRCKPGMFCFSDDGKIPNHPRWPVIIYWSAVRLPRTLDPAAVMEELFEGNGWGDSWRNGIYDYLHYHSRINEALGIARGSAKVRLGGDRGRTLKLSPGDVVILPAGTAMARSAATQSRSAQWPMRLPSLLGRSRNRRAICAATCQFSLL